MLIVLCCSPFSVLVRPTKGRGRETPTQATHSILTHEDIPGGRFPPSFLLWNANRPGRVVDFSLSAEYLQGLPNRVYRTVTSGFVGMPNITHTDTDWIIKTAQMWDSQNLAIRGQSIRNDPLTEMILIPTAVVDFGEQVPKRVIPIKFQRTSADDQGSSSILGILLTGAFQVGGWLSIAEQGVSSMSVGAVV